jgi:hypothetical protein
MIHSSKFIPFMICLCFLNSQVHGSHTKADDDQQRIIHRLSFAVQKGYVKILGNKDSNRLIRYLEGYDNEGFQGILNQIFQKETDVLEDSTDSDLDYSFDSSDDQERTSSENDSGTDEEGANHTDDVDHPLHQEPQIFSNGQLLSSSSFIGSDDRGMSISFNDSMNQRSNSLNPFWKLNQKVDKTYGFLNVRFMGSDVWGSIDLRRNSLICLPSSFDNVHRLKKINLKGNLFKVFPQPLVQASSLTTINLSHNFIDCWNGFEKCVNLEKLSLKNCRLGEVPPFIWSIESLVSLNLSENPIINWNAGDITAPLSILKISHTGLESFTLIDEKILRSLEYCDVSFNGITVVPRQWSLVKCLNLEGNPIQQFPFLSPTFEREQRIGADPRNLMGCLLRMVYKGAIVEFNLDDREEIIVSKNGGQITFVFPKYFYDEG